MPLFHGGHVEILDHDAAVGARQLGGEPVGGLPASVHTPAVEADQLGFPRGAILGSRVCGGKVHDRPVGARSASP